MSKTNYVAEAKHLASIGISVIPAKLDEKSPMIRWKEYQDRIMNERELEYYFENCGGIIAICGPVSNLFLFDFDLKYQLDDQDYWGEFCNRVPKPLLDKARIHRTRNGGFHIWVRTTYSDKSRKITRRFLLPSELNDRYDTLVANGANKNTASRILYNNPTETVIETRGNKSYGVFLHESYEKFSGNSIGHFTEDEVRLMLDAAYALDCTFRSAKIYTGKAPDHREIRNFNEDCGAEGMVRLLEASGMYTLVEQDCNGNYKLARVGSTSHFSAYVYEDSGLMKSFGQNMLDSEKDVLTPFEVYCIINDFSDDQAINTIKKKRREAKETSM